MRDALLIGIKRHLFPCRAIFFDAVREKITIKHIPHLSRIGRQPRHWIARNRRIKKPLKTAPLRLLKRIQQVPRNPRVFIQNLPPHCNDMHNRPDLSALVIILFHFDIVREQPLNIWMPLQKTGWWAGNDRAINLA